MDPRLTNISYSSLLDLHTCPRMFELKKLGAEGTQETPEQSITLTYGKVVGDGMQQILAGESLEAVAMRAFMSWDMQLDAVDVVRKKSFFLALAALAAFAQYRTVSDLRDYELVYIDGKPACELSFKIVLPDGFKYRGFVDAVLRHKVSGKIRVFEGKTTASTFIHPAMYKNSFQAIGYSIVLDRIFPELSEYEVLYMIYRTKDFSYEAMEFTKSLEARARWIHELLLDKDLIMRYAADSLFPMHGESCLKWNRECKFYQNCTQSNKYLVEDYDPERDDDRTEYQYVVTLEELIAAQLQKAQS